MSTFVTDREIIEFMQVLNEDFARNDINRIAVDSTAEYINSRLEFVYNLSGAEFENMFLDGQGEKYIYASRIPIIDIKEVAIIALDGGETQLKVVGTDRQVWWDKLTGRLEADNTAEPFFLDEDDASSNNFPLGMVNVRVNGKFGTASTALVKYLQLMLLLKHYSLMQPQVYQPDIIEEKIGRYSYRLANASNLEPENQRKGVDGYIDWLFKELNKTNELGMESM